MKWRLLTVVMALAGARVACAFDEGFEVMPQADYVLIARDAGRAYEDKRFDEAFKGFQRSACAGDKQSQSALGRMYLLGQGVERDDLTGYAWLKVAAEVTFPGHRELIDRLDAAMTAEQKKIAAAKAAQLLGLYGRRATRMSCSTYVPKGSHIPQGVLCLPQAESGQRVEVKRCIVDAPR